MFAVRSMESCAIMTFFDDVFTWLVIFGLGAIAWLFKVKPELERRRRETLRQSIRTNAPRPKSYEAEFKEIK